VELKPDGVIHLAALQMPTCKANPILGARVNVIGTLAIFEATRLIKASGAPVPPIVYASSAAVFGPDAEYGDAAVGDLAVPSPTSHYGAFKLCCEFSAKAYFASDAISSVGLRPLTVYGPGRDTGLTSSPTRALAAAIRGEKFDIPFSGNTAYIHVAEVADMFITCLNQTTASAGAHVYTVGGDTVDVSTFLKLAAEVIPEIASLVTFSGSPLPLVSKLDDASLRRDFPVARISLADGIKQTVEAYRKLHAEGKLKV
jgi:nucleoside-diphosphate-sugar epimerase